MFKNTSIYIWYLIPLVWYKGCGVVNIGYSFFKTFDKKEAQ